MADILGIGSSGLLAYRSALNVVGQNIANANTEGYSRQRVNLEARPLSGGSVPSGNGVTVRDVQRISDQFVVNRLTGQDSSLARVNTMATQTAQLDTWLSGTDTGLSKSLQGFFDAVNGLSANASSSATRQVVLTGASALTARFNTLQNSFNELDQDVDARIGEAATRISELSRQIAELNDSIAQATSKNAGQLPNDLIDQRELALRSLADQVGIETSLSEDGSINVSLGTGQALVLGGRASSVVIGPDSFGRMRDIRLSSGAASVSVTTQLSGGTIGGLLDFRREVLEPAVNELGSIAVALSTAVNAQHAKGMDQYGQLGGALFSTPSGTVTPARGNTGTATVTTQVSDAAALTMQDYTLRFDGGSWQMTSTRTGENVALSGSGSQADPFRAAGLSIVVTGSPAASDQYLLQPTRDAAGQIKLAISDTARIAAASPLRTSAASTNSGLSRLSPPEVRDGTNPQLLQTVAIRFTAADRYSIDGAGDYAVSADGSIDLNGWRVSVGGVPVAGDTFTLSRNDGASGDNTNALALLGVAEQNLLSGGRTTLSSANSALVSRVGSQSAQASAQLDAQTALSTQTQAERDSVSGVNLDEEAADLIRFQQAYQAAAQVVSTANTLFDSLLSAIRS